MSSYLHLLKSAQNDIVWPMWHDFMRSIPDSLVIGSAFFATVTQSFPLGILVLAMAEFGILFRVLAGAIGAVQGGNEQVKSDICSLGLPSPYQISIIGKVLTSTTFPSGPIYFLAATLAYILSSTMNFGQELEELGKKEPEWKARIPMSITFSILLLFLFVSWRIYSSCDSAMTALGSVGFGSIIGFIVYLLHVYLFGRDSINFLGIPLLADKNVTVAPLYVSTS